MTLAELYTKLRKMIGNPDTTEVPNSLLTEHINDAYREIATKYHHHKSRKLCSFPTVADTSKYGLPADCGAVLGVQDQTNNKKLVKAGPRQYLTWDVADVESGAPTQYARLRGFIQLATDDGGPPDDAYTIMLYYSETITSLSAASDEPVLPVTWDRGILLLARHLYYDEVENAPKALYSYQMFEAWVQNKATDIEEETFDLDSGVELPTLPDSSTRYDFDESE